MTKELLNANIRDFSKKYKEFIERHSSGKYTKQESNLIGAMLLERSEYLKEEIELYNKFKGEVSNGNNGQ